VTVEVLDVLQRRRVVRTEILPLSVNASLTWIGFVDHVRVVVYGVYTCVVYHTSHSHAGARHIRLCGCAARARCGLWRTVGAL
jgi:hypothetical protein